MRTFLRVGMLCGGACLLFMLGLSLRQTGVHANSGYEESGCPVVTAVPAYVGTGTSNFSPNQDLCLPQLAPVGGPLGPLAFVVQGSEPGLRVDAQGTIYEESIRGVPGGVDLWRWFQSADGAPNSDGTLPFAYEGQPDNCGILTNGCDNNVGSPTTLGIAPGGGDVDIAVNYPGLLPAVPNVALASLTLAPGVTATHSTDRGFSFSTPNVVAALIPGDDRQWTDAIASNTVYLTYHDVATFNIEVQRSSDGGETYVNGFGEAIDPETFPAAGSVSPTGTANIAGRIQVDRSACPSQGNLYVIFTAPDNSTENTLGQPMNAMYVGVSTDVKLGLPVFTFTDHKFFTSPAGSPGATNGNDNIFPALAVDGFGNLFAAWSDNTNIWYSASSDQGNTWSAPLRVNQGKTVGNANVFPWVGADAFGHVVVVWYGDDRPGNSNDTAKLEPCPAGSTTCMKQWTDWNVYAAETTNGLGQQPGFSQKVASDHVIHRGTVSTGGLFGNANRNLGDFFNVALDPAHLANISFDDDHLVSPLCTQQSPGHCGSDDPQTFRFGVPYFTREVHAQKVVTSGACAGTVPQTGHKMSGSGQLGSNASFAFIAQDSPTNGVLEYSDTTAGDDVRSSNGVTSVTFSGQCVTLSGNAKLNQQPGYAFTVNACDNDQPGGQDSFSINVTGPNGFSYGNAGTLTSGSIETQ